jgi:hypothetical protein
VALKRELQVNKYTTDTGTLATLLYAFFENIDFNESNQRCFEVT